MSQKKLARNISVMSFAIMISRVLGLIRDQLMAFCFGASYLNDAFVVGYRIPNLLRSLFGEGALSASFIPIYNEIGIKEDQRSQFTFALQVLSILSAFLLILTVLGIVFAPWIVKVIFAGLPPQTYKLAVILTRIMMPYLLWIGLSSTMIAILNSHDYFFMTGLSSALLNVGMILSMILPKMLGVEGVALVKWAAVGVFGGGMLQTVVNFPYLKKIGYTFRILLNFHGKAIRSLWTRFIPSLIGVGIREINLIADSLMASFLVVGSISALEYANRLFHLPLGVFAISTGMALLPTYSRLVTLGDYEELKKTLRFASVSLAYAILPVTTLILALGGDMVRILFQRGAFDERASIMTEQALFYYSLGLIFFSLNQTLTPLFYANKDTKTPVKIAAWMVGLNIVLNFIFMQFMQHRGLAFATTITAMVNFFALLILIRKSMPKLSFEGILPNILKSVLICGILYLICIGIKLAFPDAGLIQIIIRDAIIVILSLLIFYGLGMVVKLDYLHEATLSLWKKFRRK
ncbi:MAG: murein biosynthesis integral membrane protein MurJ [Candidatus Cloacimonadota bacterium]|jgi:putative peptidoglycan lipid II flippase|nr:murein biosynthesis integral membrane protein MurJ [Candidatus Cloacimonadota bacterium]